MKSQTRQLFRRTWLWLVTFFWLTVIILFAFIGVLAMLALFFGIEI